MFLLHVCREAFDMLRPQEVVWNPYYHHRGDHPFHEVAFYTSYLKCMDIVKPYHPERVLRQFSRVHTILFAPLASVRASHGFRVPIPRSSMGELAQSFIVSSKLWCASDSVMGLCSRVHRLVCTGV